jgi:phosphatidylserine/phosphatidylglycerophosphate/cardiolipin synthase-like enzyme
MSSFVPFIARFFFTIFILILPQLMQAQLLEDFEQGTKTGYAAAEVALASGSWMFDDALLGTLEGDRKNGTRSARIRAGHIQMQFDKTGGAGEIVFLAANFSSDTGGRVQVSVSTNSGTSWTPIGDPIVLTSTLTEYTVVANITGNVRVRFARTAGNRINVDDVRITDADELSDEATLAVRVNGDDVAGGDTVNFGTVTGATEVGLQLRNTGKADLQITGYSFEGPFSADGDLRVTLTQLQSATFGLRFQAGNPGEYQGSLTLQSNDPAQPTFVLQLSASVLDTSVPVSIAEARQLPLGTLVTVAGWVTVGREFAGPVYFQDETAGIAWFNNEKMRLNWEVGAEPGDSIVVTGRIGQFNNLLQIVNDVGFEVFPEARRIIEPETVTFAGLNSGAYEGRLVRIRNATFSVNGLFSGGTNYTATDGSATGQVRVDNFSNIAGAPVPTGAANIIGVAGRFLDTHQILPRSRADIREVADGPGFVTAPPYEYHATPSSVTFAWTTETEGHSEVRYGRTSSLELGRVDDQTRRTEHRITLGGLQPASAYHVQLRSAADRDTSFTNVFISSTASPAQTTGTINVYFNKSVNHTLATFAPAPAGVNFSQVLIDRLRAARTSADLAFYSLSGTIGEDIAAEILAAHNRGVEVRVIASGHSGNDNPLIVSLANAGVPAVQSLGLNQHHNKFGVFDATSGSAEGSWVVTSSWNATNDGTFSQQQNMLEIQDLALARAYQLEFNQMWGGPYGPFTASTARFSTFKQVVNPSVFWIGPDSVKVELYFSPQGNTEAQINRSLSQAQQSIDLGLNLITRRQISNTMLARFGQGVVVRGVVGDPNPQGSDFEYLSGWADVLAFPRTLGLLHHKYAIIDGENTTPNSRVITGSHNWSGNANFSNDENTLIVHSERVANMYFQEFAARYAEAGGTAVFTATSADVAEADLASVVRLMQNYPNPFNPLSRIGFELPESGMVQLEVFDMLGRRVAVMAEGYFAAGQYLLPFDGSALASGVYVYRLQTASGTLSRTMMLLK